MELKQLEPIIRSVARRYGRDFHQIEDYEQELRIKAWEIMQEGGAEKTFGYYKTSLQWAMRDRRRAENALKRAPEGGIVSINAKLNEDEFTLEDTLGKEDVRIDRPHLLEMFHKELRKEYSRNYLSKIIKSSDRPRIVAQKIVRALIEDVEGIPPEKIPEIVNYQFFIDRGLARFLWVFYGNSPFHAVNDAYRDMFVPWNFHRVPIGFWKGKQGYKHAIQAIEGFCKKRGITSREDCFKIGIEDFEKEGLITAVAKHFNNSPYLALKTQFPELKPWEAKFVPRGFLDSEDNMRTAILSFCIDTTGVSIEQLTPEETYELGLRKIVSKDSLEDYGLRGVVNRFRNSPYQIFKKMFPNQIFPWTLAYAKEVWRENPKQTAGEAIRWLFEKYLRIDHQDIPHYASDKLFWTVGFSGILTNRTIGFNSSTYRAIDNAYPGEYQKEQFIRQRKIVRLPLKDLRKPYIKKSV